MTATVDILRRHGIDSMAALGSGIEAEVYARDATTVLKLYRRPGILGDLRTLQWFYDLLDADALPYALPRILAVEDYGDIVATVEQRLRGTPMSEWLPEHTASGLHDLIGRYLDATLDVRKVRLREPLALHKLFDREGIGVGGDWHVFLGRNLDHASARLAPYFRRDVREWERKRERLREWLRQPYTGTVALVHGDIFPGNFLMEGERITALLDFGLMTMIGDPLWDVATGAVFFDMYDELKNGARERCFHAVRERLGADVLPTLYRYVMLYSVVGADTYDATCSDGHYQWCVDNLNNTAWWSVI